MSKLKSASSSAFLRQSFLRQRLFGGLVVDESTSFGWFDDLAKDTQDSVSPASPVQQEDDDLEMAISPWRKKRKIKVMKKKVSDAILPEFSKFKEDYGSRSTVASSQKKNAQRRLVSSVFIILLITGVLFLFSITNKDVSQPTFSLRTAAMKLKPRPFEALTTRKFVLGTEELLPVFERIGLARVVRVNLDKLRNAGLEETIENHLKREAAEGISDRDEGATVALLWNGRLLEFIRALVDGVLASNLLDRDDVSRHQLETDTSTQQPLPKDAQYTTTQTSNNQFQQPNQIKHFFQSIRHTGSDERSNLRAKEHSTNLVAIARLAYDATLKQHHNRVLRSAARTLLAFAPDHTTFFVSHLGYPRHIWHSELRADLEEISITLRECLQILRSLLKKHSNLTL
uniref:Glycolipid transfer protein domain-containing protein n=1 Tax=Aureoumbra lagunensis TaxID=44058 RepID=A0A7S3NL52_9STRA